MRIKILPNKSHRSADGLTLYRDGVEFTVAEVVKEGYRIDDGSIIIRGKVEVIDNHPHRVHVKDSVAGARYEWAEKRLERWGGSTNADLADLDKQGWEVISVHVEDHPAAWATYTIRRALPNPEQIAAKIHAKQLATLDDKSLDYIVEVLGEGRDFAKYNEGKSAMRRWFLSHLRDLWNLPEPPPPAKKEEPLTLG